MLSCMRVMVQLLKWAVVGRRSPCWLAAATPVCEGGAAADVGHHSRPGPSAAIEILRDAWGIPHVRAATEHDAAFGLGYAHAQDRLGHRVPAPACGRAPGRTPRARGPLRRIPTLGLHRAAATGMQSLPAESRAYLDAYVRGVNAFISSHSGRGLPC